jgi:hypothetical protein
LSLFPARLRGFTLKVTGFSNTVLSDRHHVFAGGDPLR